MPILSLSGSVGSGGVNNKEDILKVKKRLAELGFNWLTANTTVENDFIKVIKLFQSIIGGRSTVSGDGRIDVNGNTHKWLQARNAPKWIKIQGQSGIGWENTNENNDREIKYGGYSSSWLKDQFDLIGRYYKDTYQKVNSNLKPIRLNDCSPAKGGDTPDHKGHEAGLDVDLRIPKKNGSYGGIKYYSSTYDQDACRKILLSIKKKGNTRAVYFNDPVLIREGLCTVMGGHDDHIHVTFKPPSLITDTGSNSNNNKPERKVPSPPRGEGTNRSSGYSYAWLLVRLYGYIF